MIKRIDPDLFARLMKLPSKTRIDLLEYLGQTSVSAHEAAVQAACAAAADAQDDTPKTVRQG